MPIKELEYFNGKKPIDNIRQYMLFYSYQPLLYQQGIAVDNFGNGGGICG